jgi:hypothetical protein
MKIKLTLDQAAHVPFVQGFLELRNLPATADQIVLVDIASEKIVAEHHRFNRLRGEYVTKHFGDPKNGITVSGDDPRVAALQQFEKELGAQSFEIRLVKKLKIPPVFSITAAQYRSLLSAGIVEEISVPDDEEEPKKQK